MGFSPRSYWRRQQTDSVRRITQRATKRRLPGGTARQLHLEPLEIRLVLSFAPATSPIDVTGSPTNPVAGIGGQVLSTHRTSAEMANGDYRVVWEDTQLGIYTRLFSASGVPLGSPVHVANTTAAADSEATIAINLTGGAVIAWTDHNADSGQTSVEMQLFSGLTQVGSPIIISSAFESGSAHQPSVAIAGAHIVVAYTDSNSSGSSNRIKAIEMIGTGGAQTPITVTKSTTTSQPSVAMNPTGNFVIAYTEGASAFNQVASGHVLVQQFNSGGAPQGSRIVVGSAGQIENEPSTAIAANGKFVVAYTHITSSKPGQTQAPNPISFISNRTDVDAVLFNAQGSVLQTDTVWTSANPSQNGYDPSAAMDATGKFVIGYTTGGNYADYDPTQPAPTSVLASAYDNTGTLLQAGIDLAANMPVYEKPDIGIPFLFDSIPSVALSPFGHLVADWENFGTKFEGDVAGSGVFTQTFVNSPFQYQLSDGINIPIVGGMPTTYQIDITRDSGFTGPISISVAPLPAGVTDTVSADSNAPSEVRTITFNSNDGVTSQQLLSVLSISAGQVTLTPSVHFTVAPSVITSVTADVGITVPNVLVLGQPATISGSGFSPAYAVQFGSNGPMATPTSIDPTGTSLTVVVPLNYVPGKISILRTGGQTIVSSFSPTYTEGAITSLNGVNGQAVGFAMGYSTIYSSALVGGSGAGSQLTILGYNFQPGDRVLFGPQLTPPPDPTATAFYASAANQNVPGNAPTSPADWLATAQAYGAVPTNINPLGDSLSVNVPEDAVSGLVTIVQPDGNILQSTRNFQVFSFRNSFGFSFLNGPDGIDAMGNNHSLNGQTTVPDAWDDFSMTLGELGDEFPGSLDALNIATTNLQLAFWQKSLDNNGSCFGMDTTASLLYQEFGSGNVGNVMDLGPTPPPLIINPNNPAINFSNPNAPVFSLAWNTNLTMNGLTLPLVTAIHLNLLSQMSNYVTTSYFSQTGTDLLQLSQNLVAPFVSQITSQLKLGQPPIVGITPAGHSVLAYNVEQDASGGYYIDCYNPNDPIDSSATDTKQVLNSATNTSSAPGNAVDANGKGVYYLIQSQAGMREEDNQDRIHVDSAGNWIWTQNDGQVFAGSLNGGGLQVYGVNINAVNHNTSYVGPAGTMTLPGPGNNVLVDLGIITAPVVAGTLLGTALVVGETILEFLGPNHAPTAANNPLSDVTASGLVPSVIANSSSSAPSPPAALMNGLPSEALDSSSMAQGIEPLGMADTPHDRAILSVAGELDNPASTWWVGSAAGSNFANIQSAISSASVHNGDTIMVEPGTYSDAGLTNDTLTVNKSLTILGGQSYPDANQKGPSIVTSNDVGFTLDANNISIQQFSVKPTTFRLGTAGIATDPAHLGSGYQIRNNDLEDEGDGLHLNTMLPNSAYASTVSGNSFKDNTNGIFSDLGMSNVTILKNNFTGDTNASVKVDGSTVKVDASSLSSNVKILNNQIIDDAAIILQDATHSTIAGNNIVNPTGTNGDGIWLAGGVVWTEVAHNSLHSDSGPGNGVESRGAGNSNDAISWNTVLNFNNGIVLDSAIYDTVFKNTIRKSETDGIQLTDHSVHDTVADNLADGNSVGILLLISNSNTISHNATDGNLNGGIDVAASNNDSITGNTANSNAPEAIGILIFGDSNTVSGNTADYNWLGIVSTMSTGTTISGNTANNNKSDGIEVQYDVNAPGEKDTVFGNTANDNLNGGISLLLSTYVTVSHNVANNNMVFGIEVQNTSEAKTYDTISDNTANNNLTGDGISLINDDNTTVSGNTASQDGVDGVALQTSSNNTISGNTANNNVNDGIDVDVDSLTNTFTMNTAMNNGNWDLQDASMGLGTAGTANTWSNNNANSRSPSGLS